MTLDTVPFCYKEYPAIPEMQCLGHATHIRWGLVMPVMIITTLIILSIGYAIIN